MTRWICAVLILMSALAAAGREANASVRFALAGSLALTNEKLDPLGPGVTQKAGVGYGGGLLLEVALGRALSADFGALYYTRESKVTDVLGDVITSSSGIMIPAALRIWTNPYLSFGFGGYYARTLGKVTVEDFTGSAEYDPPVIADYGVLASVGLEAPITKTTQFFADGRYLYGVADGDPSAAGKINRSDLQLLVGFRFGESWIKR
jgi:hypothetical protein